MPPYREGVLRCRHAPRATEIGRSGFSRGFLRRIFWIDVSRVARQTRALRSATALVRGWKRVAEDQRSRGAEKRLATNCTNEHEWGKPRWRRGMRRRHGLCPDCGYDIH